MSRRQTEQAVVQMPLLEESKGLYELLAGAIEALLFVTDAPLSLKQLAEILKAPLREVQMALEQLRQRRQQEGGLQVVEIAEGYQLCTKPLYASFIARLLNPPHRRLSRPALEVLAIVAYRQPVTQAQIDALRGVDSSHTVRQLVERGFLQEVGRKQSPGRPLLYGVTPQFLHYFGLKNLEELPPLEEVP